MCFEGKWLQNRLRAGKNDSRSLLAVDIQGYLRGGFCIVPIMIITIMIMMKDDDDYDYDDVYCDSGDD